MTDYTSNPTAADIQDDIQTLVNEDRYARTLANIARRAENLWDDGYSARLQYSSASSQLYLVKTPAGEFYTVTLSDQPKHEVFGDSCSCPAYAKYGECKHHLAIVWQVGEQAQADAFDAMMADAEGPMGCDPDARY